MWPIRSALFVPAHRRDWVGKAIRVGPHAAVLDIEDSVPPQFKSQAMDHLHSEIHELRDAGVGAFVRIQPLFEGTPAEIKAAVTDGLTAIVMPKVATPDEVRQVHDLLSHAEGRAGLPLGTVGILPLPETAQGMYDAYHLAKASSRVRGIHGAISGPVSGDFARAFGFRATSGGEEQLYLASKLVLDSRAAGAMYPLAGIFGTAQDDLPAVEALIRKARDIGYSGVAVMHPSHVPIANAVYRPTAEEVAYFTGLLEAFDAAEKAGLGAVSYKGAMVDYAMLPLAKEVLAEAARNR
ncbi:MAG TPA: CoA ester lyase [Rhodopila sp.]|uniref:HpcH/HpaI aldolase/citrate lyase family protein n=1 Tax=Rhodopila sp. TaxID=2480087 RepID=UPI002C520412|nr:CoA ester lyase [Rhodopila sp.]HVY14130.1 CoA ester lyase [Rhodopila sp.]